MIEVCKIFKLLDNIRFFTFLICQQHVRLDVKKIFLSYKSNRYMELSAWISIAMCNSGHIQETNRPLFKQEAQLMLMLTSGSTRLLAVSRARAISDGTLT